MYKCYLLYISIIIIIIIIYFIFLFYFLFYFLLLLLLLLLFIYYFLLSSEGKTNLRANKTGYRLLSNPNLRVHVPLW